LDLWLSVLCMRSKAWLAAPILLAHAEVTKNIIFFQWVQNLGTRRYCCCCAGYLKDVLYTNLTAVNCNYTILIMSNYYPEPSVNSLLQVSNVTFSDITASGSRIAGQIGCSSATPCQDLVFSNVIHTQPLPGEGWTCAYAHGVADNVVPALKCLSD
jgi:hypothetical protein